MATPVGQTTVKAKVVLLGEGQVGKTSIILRFVENKFDSKQAATSEASFCEKKLTIGGQRLSLTIWDTAGQEIYHALGPIYYRDSQGAIVVYDITDQDSFIKARNWIKELRKIIGDNIVVCIVGNKIDLEKNRTVDMKEAEDYAASIGATHFQASAKQDKGINELFLDLSKMKHAGVLSVKTWGNIMHCHKFQRVAIESFSGGMVPVKILFLESASKRNIGGSGVFKYSTTKHPKKHHSTRLRRATE